MTTNKAMARRIRKSDDRDGLRLDEANPYLTYQLTGYVAPILPVDQPDFANLFACEEML